MSDDPWLQPGSWKADATTKAQRQRPVVVGIESDHLFVDTDIEWWQPGESGFRVLVPEHLVDELLRAYAVWRNARDAILGHVHLDPQTGCLPLCDAYNGQAHEWNGRMLFWDDCWRCGHDHDEHAAITAASGEDPHDA